MYMGVFAAQARAQT